MAGYFSIFLVMLTLGSGLIWLIDAWVFAPKRKERLSIAEGATGSALDEETINQIAPRPAIAEGAQSIFPMVAAITIFRSFLYEPFQIPSGSMMPTLLVGDFILVEKYSFGVKDPVWRSQLFDVGTPKRGDITVFKYPQDTRIDFIKRVVALPGDTVRYRNKQLFIKPRCEAGQVESNGLKCGQFNKQEMVKVNDGQFSIQGSPLRRMTETVGSNQHDILIHPRVPEFKGRYYPQRGTPIDEWRVPEGHYFAVGDNRDNSQDSRFWGFIPEENLVGKAVMIWMSFEFNNGPDSWLPGWIPTGVRLERLGKIQ